MDIGRIGVEVIGWAQFANLEISKMRWYCV